MLYATYKNRLRSGPNPFIGIYGDNAFSGFSKYIGSFYGRECRYCGEVLTPQNIGLDHIVPLKRGGTSEMTNLDPGCCKRCNRRKGELTSYEYSSLLKFLEDKPIMKAIVIKRLSAAGFMFFKRTKV